jgi:hypothetical protein
MPKSPILPMSFHDETFLGNIAPIETKAARQRSITTIASDVKTLGKFFFGLQLEPSRIFQTL